MLIWEIVTIALTASVSYSSFRHLALGFWLHGIIWASFTKTLNSPALWTMLNCFPFCDWRTMHFATCFVDKILDPDVVWWSDCLPPSCSACFWTTVAVACSEPGLCSFSAVLPYTFQMKYSDESFFIPDWIWIWIPCLYPSSLCEGQSWQESRVLGRKWA